MVDSLKYYGDYQDVCYLSIFAIFGFFFFDHVTSGAVCRIIRMRVITYGSCGSWLEIVTMALWKEECGMRT